MDIRKPVTSALTALGVAIEKAQAKAEEHNLDDKVVAAAKKAEIAARIKSRAAKRRLEGTRIGKKLDKVSELIEYRSGAVHSFPADRATEDTAVPAEAQTEATAEPAVETAVEPVAEVPAADAPATEPVVKKAPARKTAAKKAAAPAPAAED